jgi:peroxin-7
MNQSAPSTVLHTPGFAHSNVAWSPLHTTRIAIASSANYGIIGNGRLNIASTLSSPSGTAGIKLDKLSVQLDFFFPIHLAVKLMPRLASYETQDGLYDLAWSEVHENQLVTVSGDGSIKLWDVALNVSTHTSLPIA